MDPFTSEWWLDRLGKELDERERKMDRYEDYYEGHQPLVYASQRFREAFRDTYGKFADNFCKLVVQAVEERLTVQGFRFGSKARDAKVWRTWQANQLDAWSQRAHREALIKGECPVIVAPPAEPGGFPVIRVQEAEEVVIAYGDDPLVRAVAMKRWRTVDDRLLATLYFADRLEKYEWLSTGTGTPARWVPRIVDGEPWPLPHSLGAVPVVAIVNDPDIDGDGESELCGVVPLQDALNKHMLDMLISSEFAAFRQKWATGLEIPVDPETNKPIELFKAAADRVWLAADKDTKFGDFDQSDLTNFVTAIETTIQHIATITRTPSHYLLGSSGTFPSGESLRATETGLVAKAKRRTRDYGEAWEEVMRLALAAMGDVTGSKVVDAETVWADPEYRTESQHIDALLKLSSLGVPEEQLWEDAGYSPQLIEKFKAIRAAQPPAIADASSAAAAAALSGNPPAA